MKVIYNSRDIYDQVDIRIADMTLNSGAKLDSITVEFNNSDNEWSSWNPRKNDTLEIRQDGLSSGRMYIDTIKQKESVIVLKALPIKKSSKEKHTKSWEHISLIELLKEFSQKHKLTLKTYNITNYRYERVNQINQSDFIFLHQRCALEGYVFKIQNNSLIVFDEKALEQQSRIEITKDEIIGDFDYKVNDAYKGVRIKYRDIDYTYYSPEEIEGPIYTITDLLVSNYEEAQRFTKNILRNTNKYQSTLAISTKLRSDISAGSVVSFRGTGLADGDYYIFQSINRITSNRNEFALRKVLRW
ncbi:MAG: phage late control D family protein [Firmicutes bacterium]|nr:phage late control D family protein [Bacillota bacterium]